MVHETKKLHNGLHKFADCRKNSGVWEVSAGFDGSV